MTQFVPAVRETATPEQQARFLGGVAAGEIQGSLAIAERSGSYDPGAVQTTVVLEQDAQARERRVRNSSASA